MNIPNEITGTLSRTSVGSVIAVNGSRAKIALDQGGRPAGSPDDEDRLTVGRILKINTGRTEVLGMISSSRLEQLTVDGLKATRHVVEAELVGEIMPPKYGKSLEFRRGVGTYPTIGDTAFLVSGSELETAYNRSYSAAVNIGSLQQDDSVPAIVDATGLLTRHFAILGTTGVGKSCGVAVVLREVLKKISQVRILMIDPHNEYRASFGDKAEFVNPNNTNLPFWMFNFEEIVDVIFKGRPGVETEVEILAELIPIAKKQYAAGHNIAPGQSLRRRDGTNINYTVDTPVPYRISDLLAALDTRIGSLDNKTKLHTYRSLKARIEAVVFDPRYAFMFGKLTIDDRMSSVLGQLFRIPIKDKPITIVEIAGFPSEIVDSLVSVLCRLAFDLGVWSDGKVPTVVVCEEAHRYVPADRDRGFGPTKRAISRIAKEGRKYGIFLGIVSQRPSELDPTILSQCNSLITMRLANDHDHSIVRAAVSDAASSMLEFLPSLGSREAIAFGDAVAMPMRLRFGELPPDRMPRSLMRLSGAVDIQSDVENSSEFLGEIVEKWRTITVDTQIDADDPLMAPPQAAAERPAPPPVHSPSPNLQGGRSSLLKKPISETPAFADRPPLRRY